MCLIVVCDDEKDLRRGLSLFLEMEGYQVLEAENGKQALDILREQPAKLLLLDWMMPVMDGIQTLKALREFSDIPVIALTAKSENEDKILGLGEGADDYVTKPYVPEVLAARIRAQLRRYTQWSDRRNEQLQHRAPEEITAGEIVLNTAQHEVRMGGESVPLTRKEYELLLFFMTHPNQTWSSRELYEAVWQEQSMGSEGTVSVHVRHLREKLEIDPSNPRYLKVIWGRGYRMEAEK